MDLQSLFFVIVVIAIGGFSAYLADILGYKIGKKRLTIKRIRPKYVARISVVIAGMLIPIFTMLLLYGVSSTFRTWITRGSEIVRDLEQKSREVDKVNGQLVEGERKNADLSNKNRIIDDELKKKQAEAAPLEAKLKSQKEEVNKLNASIKDILLEKNKAQAELGPLKSKLLTIQKEVLAVQKSLSAANVSLKEAEANYKETSKKYSLTSSQNLKLTNDNFDLEKKNKAIQQASDDLQVVIKNLNKDLEILKSQKTTAESETIRAKSDLTVVLNELTRIRLETKAATDNLNAAYRLKPISYLRGEELTRISVPGNASQAEATTIYRALLRRAKSIATDHGARPDTEIYPFSGSAGSILTGTGTDSLSEDEVEKYWVEQLRSVKDPAVMIAKSATNRFESEPIELQIIIFANPIVFRKGEIVTESKIDGRMSDIEILNGIRDFLRTFVNTKARTRHMIPVLARDGESYGEFTQDQLLSAVAAVKAVPRLARLVAVARQDIRAGDPLDITLEVR